MAHAIDGAAERLQLDFGRLQLRAQRLHRRLRPAHLDAKHASAGTTPEDLERRVLRHYDLYIPKMLASYGHALCNGHRTVYKTLLKFLTRWLDTAHILHLHITRSTTNSKRNIALAQNVLRNIHAQVDDVLERENRYEAHPRDRVHARELDRGVVGARV